MKLNSICEEQTKHQFFKTREEVEAWLEENHISNYTINDDLVVDVDENVFIRSPYFMTAQESSTVLPVSFGRINGSFDISSCNLSSLIGCPKEVEDYFSAQDNMLTSLEGAPREIGGTFNCSRNRLQTLKGGPKIVGGTFKCGNNILTSLEGAPREVGGSFDCCSNFLETLNGCPREIRRTFRML